MIATRGTGRALVVVLVLLLVAAACGSDSADPARFCQINDELNELDPFAGGPDEARDMVRRGRALLDEAVEVTPNEIRGPVEVAAESFGLFLDLAEAAEFDPEQLDQAGLEAAFSAEAIAAGEAIDEWAEANCST